MRSDYDDEKVVAAALIILIVTSLFLGVSSTQDQVVSFFQIKNPVNTQRLFSTLPLAFYASFNNDTFLNQSTRVKILSFIEENPGTHFRGVCDGLGLSVGVVQFHLDLLVDRGFLSVFRDGGLKRFFRSGAFEENEMMIISLLRHEVLKDIVTTLFQIGCLSHKDLASRLSISSQVLTWHMKKLRGTGFIDIIRINATNRYFLNHEKSNNLIQHL